jgi:quercetin dioxygenase-like cupin family protein
MTNDTLIVREPLLAAHLDGTPAIERVRSARIALAPGQATGRHHHPCPVVGYVAAGTIRFQIEGQPDRILTPGDAFHEPAGARIAHFDNASDTERAVFIAFYLLPPGEERLIVAETQQPTGACGASSRPHDPRSTESQ